MLWEIDRHVDDRHVDDLHADDPRNLTVLAWGLKLAEKAEAKLH